MLLDYAPLLVPTPSPGGSSNRVVLDEDWRAPDLYAETTVHLTVSVTSIGEVDMVTRTVVHVTAEHKALGVEFVTAKDMTATVHQAHNAPFIVDTLELLDFL